MPNLEVNMNDNARTYEQDVAVRAGSWDEADFKRTFHHQTAVLENKIRIHYVIGGDGPPVVLLHGFPQHWREWRLIMPMLADAGYTVIAPDLRGFGLSDKPLAGFDVGTVADDVRQTLDRRGLQHVSLVGHDVGAGVAYAWAAAYPGEVRHLVLMEGLHAGLQPSSGDTPTMRGRPLWHLAFGSTPDVPEPFWRIANGRWSNSCLVTALTIRRRSRMNKLTRIPVHSRVWEVFGARWPTFGPCHKARHSTGNSLNGNQACRCSRSAPN
jgi:pimeloyl-ACP methyl ester carboxylesterase